MAQVTNAENGSEYRGDFDESRDALHRLPVCTGRVPGRGLHGSWNGCRDADRSDQRLSGSVRKYRLRAALPQKKPPEQVLPFRRFWFFRY